MKKKIISSIIILLLLTMSVMGCSKENTPVNTEEEANNKIDVEIADIYNSSVRMDGVLSKVDSKLQEFVTIMENIKTNSPVDYWDEKNYVSLPNITIEKGTFDFYKVFNSTQTFDEICNTYLYPPFKDENGKWTVKEFNVKEVTPNSKYSVSVTDNASMHYQINLSYDSDHDWTQLTAYKYKSTNSAYDNYDLYEYARKNKQEYFLQTTTDRLYVVLNEDKTIKEFYYTKLNGLRRPKYPYQYDNNGNWIPDEKAYPGKVLNIYDYEDTLFPHINEINGDWVAEEEPNLFQTHYIYKDGILTYERYNELSNKIERYTVDNNNNVNYTSEDYIAPVETESEEIEGTEEPTENVNETK